MKKLYYTNLMLFALFLIGCTATTDRNKEHVVRNIPHAKDSSNSQPKSVPAVPPKTVNTSREIYEQIIGSYVYMDDQSEALLKLDLRMKNGEISYRLKTNERTHTGFAKISQDAEGQVVILFPIAWDQYEGDLTSDNQLESSEGGENDNVKPQEISMSFDPEFKNLTFQNYGNAMNSYTVFEEFSNKKYICLNKMNNR